MHSQVLAYFAVAYAYGITLAAWTDDPRWLFSGILMAPLSSAGRSFSALLLGGGVAWAGFGSIEVPRERALRAEPPRESVVLEGRVAGLRHGANGQRIRLCDLAAAGPSIVLPPCVLLWMRGEVSPPVLGGDRMRFEARFRRPRPAKNPGAIDRRAREARRGVGWEGSLVHPALWAQLGPDSALRGLRRAFAAWRLRLGESLAARGPGGALLAALALGDRRGLRGEHREALARLGLAHLIAVSGLHVGLVAVSCFWAVAFLAGRWSWLGERRDPRDFAAAAALLAVWCYAGLSGFAIPVQRAAVFASCLLFGALLRLQWRGSGLLGLAATWILLREPSALFDPGAQLSFSAAAALLWTSRRENPPATGMAANFHAALVALLATGPLVAWHFARASVWGLLANLVAVPATACLLLPMAALAAAAEPWAPACAEFVASVAERCLGLVIFVAGELPVDELTVDSRWRSLLAAVIALLTLARASSTRSRLLGLCLLQGVLRLPLPSNPTQAELWFFDVGHGDAALVRGKDVTALIDTGGASPASDRGRDLILPALRTLGVKRLDLLVISHADLDHRGGALSLLRSGKVRALWLPYGANRESAFSEVIAAAARFGVPISYTGQGGVSLELGEFRFVPLWPPRERNRRKDLSENDRSLVLRVDHARGRMLFSGDVEGSAERALALGAPRALNADILKVPHHGSATSSTKSWLRAVAPKVCVISAADPPRFGLPHREALERLAAECGGIHVTGQRGALRIPLAPELQVQGWLDE